MFIMNDLKKMLSFNVVSDPACKLVKAEQRNYFRFLRQVEHLAKGVRIRREEHLIILLVLLYGTKPNLF